MSNQHINATRKSRSHRSGWARGTRYALLSGAILAAGSLGGCDNAGEGLFSGAALGAVTGLAIGSLSGNAGEGAVLGTIIGGAGGAVIGDQNERNRENARYGQDRYDRHGRYEPRPRSRHPYCSEHRTYHAHGEYHYHEWWND